MKPIGNRVLLQVNIIKVGEEERPSQEAKVLDSSLDGVKKGDTVFFNPYGAVSIDSKKTKKHMFLVVDEEDIYAKL